ncbi:MAG: HAMP domain-containing histidine kinase [Candidatus Zixiibacteriota bacterium]|nr:MAG: HAMP domain-containing histidine kinase [candidate division Zixibacteria bacterium]
MSLFSRKYRGSSYVGYSTFFKGFLISGMIVVVGIFIYFSQTIVSGLRADAARVSQAYARLIQYGASEATDPAVIDFIFENIITKVNFPIVVTDKNGVPVAWTVDIDPADTSPEAGQKLYKYVREFDRENQPIEITSQNEIISILHYGDSNLIGLLQLIPAIEIFVVGFFILIAFVGFRHIQLSEQRSIWVGMAKETAHQLGTPLSSLIGWVELLRLKYEEGKMKFPSGDSETDFDEVSTRMLGDLKRLDRIATRFGQIGSIPDFEENDLNDVISEVVSYFKARIPIRGISVIEKYGEIPRVKINTELISWVIENLIKNSMESTSPKAGIISIKTEYDPGHKNVLITVEDNGRGIPPSRQKKIFAPGFTTKKRGWGLGLTLAKRIVEEYHKGKISLKYSDPGIRTAFGIELPV